MNILQNYTRTRNGPCRTKMSLCISLIKFQSMSKTITVHTSIILRVYISIKLQCRRYCGKEAGPLPAGAALSPHHRICIKLHYGLPRHITMY